ncbi:hypothetical protein Tco_1274508 [Tanacetum coccineum]
MARKCVKFSGKVTPLFDSMLVPHQAPKGEGLEQPTEPQPTPSPTHPSTGDQPPVSDSSSSHDTTQDSKDSLKDTNGSEGTQVQLSYDSPLSGDHTSKKAEGGLNLEELFVLCTNLSNRVLALETSKDAQAAEILKLKDQIMKLKRKCKPSIAHHRAWLKSVKRLSMKKSLRRKESVSKQGRKNAKPKPTLDAFDDLDADGRDYIETEDVVKEGRQSNEIEELNKGSGEKGGSTKELEFDDDVSEEYGWLQTIDPKDKGKSVLEEPEPAKKMTRSDFDAAQIARDAKIARHLQVDLQAEVERERQREKEASKAAIAETYDEVQVGIDADALAAERSAEIRKIQGLYERQKRVIDDFKPMDFQNDVSKVLKEATDADLVEEEQLKAFLKIVPDEEGIIDYEFLEKRFPIINWELKFYDFDRHGTECIYYRIFRSDGSSRWINTFSEMVTRFDRLDLVELYNLVIKRFETTTPEDGTEIHMLAERKYPLIKETLERMLSLRLVAGTTSEDAYTLLRFIQKQIDEYGSHDGGEKEL